MKKTVLTFGLVSGAIMATMIALMVPMGMRGEVDFDKSELIGYTVMVLSFLTVFFGIRTYRQDACGGTIAFGKAFRVGILITLVSCAVYVVSWEIVYFNFLPDFAERFTEHVIEKLRGSGASEAAIEAERQKMARFKELYKNPFFNAGITFLEVFPVGLIVTLVSAAILRRKSPPGTPTRSDLTGPGEAVRVS